MLYLTFSSQTAHINKPALQLHTLCKAPSADADTLLILRELDIFYIYISTISFFFFKTFLCFRKSKRKIAKLFFSHLRYVCAFSVLVTAFFNIFLFCCRLFVIILDGKGILHARLLPHVKTEPLQQTSK